MELGFGLTKIIPLIAYMVFIVVVVLTIMKRIEIGILFLVPLIPQQSLMESINQYPLGKDIVDVILIAMLIRWFVESKKRPEGMFIKNPVNAVIFAMIVWTYIELWLGSFNLNLPLPISIGDERFVTWKNFMILPLMYMIVVNNIEDKRFIIAIFVLMALSMLFMDRHFYNNFAGRSTAHFSDDLRSAGTFTYLGPNELAAFYAQYTLVLMCVLFVGGQMWLRVLAGVVTVFNYYCMIYLFSRGGYLATLVGWTALGILRERKFLVVIAVLLIFWKFFMPTAVIERIEMTQTEEGTDTSVLERLELWNAAAQVFESNPLMGIGYNTTPYFGFSDSITKRHRNNLHNGYLEVLSEMGIIGLLIYLTIFFRGMQAGWRLYKLADDAFFKAIGLGFVISILASLTANLTGNNWHYFNVAGFFWVNYALVVRSTLIFEKERIAGGSPAADAPSPGSDQPKPTVEPSYV